MLTPLFLQLGQRLHYVFAVRSGINFHEYLRDFAFRINDESIARRQLLPLVIHH